MPQKKDIVLVGPKPFGYSLVPNKRGGGVGIVRGLEKSPKLLLARGEVGINGRVRELT